MSSDIIVINKSIHDIKHEIKSNQNLNYIYINNNNNKRFYI